MTVGDAGISWAAPFEADAEFGGLGPHMASLSLSDTARTKREYMSAVGNTTIAIVATDADLSKAQLSPAGGGLPRMESRGR